MFESFLCRGLLYSKDNTMLLGVVRFNPANFGPSAFRPRAGATILEPANRQIIPGAVQPRWAVPYGYGVARSEKREIACL